MARAPLYIEVKDPAGNYVSGASVQVNDRHTGAAATIYTAETAGTTTANPIIADSAGHAFGWVDRGAYSAVISGAGITTYTIPVDTPNTDDATGTSPWLPTGAVTPIGGFFGKSMIATTQVLSSTAAYSFLTTPDRVQNVVVSANGLVAVCYRALWQNSFTISSFASIFIGSNQMRVPDQAGSGNVVQEIVGGFFANDDDVLYTTSGGLASTSVSGNATDITTGETVGVSGGVNGWCYIWVTPGTYDIGIKFRNVGANSVTVKNRKLWVWAPPG
jgi:hypothetical protein